MTHHKNCGTTCVLVAIVVALSAESLFAQSTGKKKERPAFQWVNSLKADLPGALFDSSGGALAPDQCGLLLGDFDGLSRPENFQADRFETVVSKRLDRPRRPQRGEVIVFVFAKPGTVRVRNSIIQAITCELEDV